MENGQPFTDYYSVLHVHPECDARTLEIAYRHLAKIYHPDHPETADLDQFNHVVEAYSLLRKPKNRASYDVLYTLHTGFVFGSTADGPTEGTAVLSDATAHASILTFLYKKRRACGHSPGAGAFDILRNLNCSEDSFDFHAWYLKKKGFIETLDDGTFAITVEGVDHVITMTQTSEKRLRIVQSDGADWAERQVA